MGLLAITECTSRRRQAVWTRMLAPQRGEPALWEQTAEVKTGLGKQGVEVHIEKGGQGTLQASQRKGRSKGWLDRGSPFLVGARSRRPHVVQVVVLVGVRYADI